MKVKSENAINNIKWVKYIWIISHKNNEVLIPATVWINLEKMLSERSQMPKFIYYCIFTFV